MSSEKSAMRQKSSFCTFLDMKTDLFIETVIPKFVYTAKGLRTERKRAKLTLRRLSKKTGLSVAYLCAIEGGRMTCPKRTKKTIERALRSAA